jgi:molybdopterin molybdotransferase
MVADPDTQRITRLTPLHEVLARIDALVEPVAPRELGVAAACGRVLAADLILPIHPGVAVALRDGWAISSDLTTDATSYAPAPLPAATRIDAGEPMPAGADAVGPLDIVAVHGSGAEIMAQVGQGEGVLPAGADAVPSSAFLQAGKCLSRLQVAALAAAGVSRALIRAPRLRVVCARPGRDPIIDAAAALVGRAIAAEGGTALIAQAEGDDAPLADALKDQETDAVVAVGGTGSGRNDASVRALASFGRIEVHGIALSPGETAAFGFAGARPVLLLPGRLDAALAVWLLLGRRMLARLSASIEEPQAVTAKLARKVASSLGLAELIPVRLRDGKAEPLGAGYLPLQTLVQSDGWILIGADREGYPAGTEVMVRPWP